MYTESYVKPYVGEKMISQITSFNIQKLYTKLRKQGRIHAHPDYGHQLADATINRVHCMKHHAMKTAVLRQNPKPPRAQLCCLPQ